MLAWDSFRCHALDSVKQELNRAKIDPVIVPGGCIKYIQAPNVSWNKPYKAKVTEKYDEWMANGQHTEDELIHCLKPNQPCHSDLAQLKAVQQQLQQILENDLENA